MPDYYTLLVKKITEADNDPAKLRELVYEAARLALKRHVNVYYPAVSLRDGKRLLGDLEAAIERLEKDSGGTVRRPSASSSAGNPASVFAPAQTDRPANYQEFNFRAAYEGKLDDQNADHRTNENPATKVPRFSDQAALFNLENDEKQATLASTAGDRRTFTAPSDDYTRRWRTPRPNNRFSTGHTNETRASIPTTSLRPDVSDRSLTQDRGASRNWSRDVSDDAIPGSRELVLVPNRSVPASHGSTHLVRSGEFPSRQGEYYRDQSKPPNSSGRKILIGVAIMSQVAIVILAGTAFFVAMRGAFWGPTGPIPAAQGVAAATSSHLPAKVPAPVVPAARSVVLPPADTSTLAMAATMAIAPSAVAAATPAFPRPIAYGVYAISANRLIELEQISTAPVDPRTRSTLQIVKPSRTIITDPKLTFVAFRRDLISSAPDKVPIRIAARIAKQMTFDGSAKAVTAPPPTDTWLIRDQGYDLRVSPMRETPEMVMMRPDSEDFSFPPGRYELMLGAQYYDFVIAGAITDPAQCVEGIATARGPAFYECRAQ